MADAGTLATTAQVLLAIGENASATQILEANTNIWILYAESDMEKAFGDNISLVANYASITAAMKQWLALVASNRAAFYAINQDQNNWALSTTQSKLNIVDTIWTGFLKDINEPNNSIVDDMGL